MAGGDAHRPDRMLVCCCALRSGRALKNLSGNVRNPSSFDLMGAWQLDSVDVRREHLLEEPPGWATLSQCFLVQPGYVAWGPLQLQTAVLN